MKGLYISAAHKSSGKTTISIGLCAALSGRGLLVQPFKKGPDYIDPMWLAQSSGRPCYNLDFYTQSREEISRFFCHRSRGHDLALVEGNKGLFDGMDVAGSDCNAALAKHLKLPVVLVLDTIGTIRGLVPLLLGYQAFDQDVNIAGVILNKVGGARHESKLRNMMQTYTDIPLLGCVHRNDNVALLERHLGLIPSNEAQQAQAHVDEVGRVIADSVDLDRLLEVSGELANGPRHRFTRKRTPNGPMPLKLGIARDAAFGFYYADDLEHLQAAGAELVEVDMMRDTVLPPGLDGLFIGGGFPESFGAELSRNKSMRVSVLEAIENGLPVYAECGGLMYLSRSIQFQGQTHEMVGAVPGDAVMTAKPVGRGYTRLSPAEDEAGGWGQNHSEICAHEFHYSVLQNLPADADFAFGMVRGQGIAGRRDGYRYKNLLAGYAHFRDTERFHWCGQFLGFMKQVRQQRMLQAVAESA